MATQESPETGSGAASPSFPQSKAFVIRFSAETGPGSGLFRGAVEHVTSGDRTTFESTEDLWTFVRAILERPAAPLAASATTTSEPSAQAVTPSDADQTNPTHAQGGITS